MIFKPNDQDPATHSPRNTTKVIRVHVQNYYSIVLIGNIPHIASKQEKHEQ